MTGNSAVAKGAAPGKLRIIGGEWRSRQLPVPQLQGLRPTTDRIRETLFNWLAGELHGARCLDLFAGSGALGLEALSRGAARCDFVELDRAAATTLGDSLALLGAGARARVLQTDALRFLQQGHSGDEYDLVFLDPPFAAGLLDTATRQLVASEALAADALIYREYAAQGDAALPAGWERWRCKKAGNVQYELLYRADS